MNIVMIVIEVPRKRNTSWPAE